LTSQTFRICLNFDQILTNLVQIFYKKQNSAEKSIKNDQLRTAAMLALLLALILLMPLLPVARGFGLDGATE
jgi:hypothetical protein